MVQLTKEMIEDKLRQIAIHEKRFGKCCQFIDTHIVT